MTEAWLSGPVEGVPEPLMPAAHALLDAAREIDEAVRDLSLAAEHARRHSGQVVTTARIIRGMGLGRSVEPD